MTLYKNSNQHSSVICIKKKIIQILTLVFLKGLFKKNKTSFVFGLTMEIK